MLELSFSGLYSSPFSRLPPRVITAPQKPCVARVPPPGAVTLPVCCVVVVVVVTVWYETRTVSWSRLTDRLLAQPAVLSIQVRRTRKLPPPTSLYTQL